MFTFLFTVTYSGNLVDTEQPSNIFVVSTIVPVLETVSSWQ